MVAVGEGRYKSDDPVSRATAISCPPMVRGLHALLLGKVEASDVVRLENWLGLEMLVRYMGMLNLPGVSAVSAPEMG